MIPRRRCGPPGISACAMRPRSGSRKRSAARSASSITTKAAASISTTTCASFCKNRTSMPGHDAQAKELGTEKSRLEVLEQLGLKTITLAPMHRIEDGINAVRVFLPKCWFDAGKCARGIDALNLSRAEVDATRVAPSGVPLLKPHPVHDWASHAADSFRYLALTLDARAARSGFHRRLEYAEQGVV